MSNHYELRPAGEGFQFTNLAGDDYYVYLTTYSLLDPKKVKAEGYIDVFMLGFSCKRLNLTTNPRFDARTKASILKIINSYLNLYPNQAFVYVCDNQDGRARNRRITFGRWFRESKKGYLRIQSHLQYEGSDWFSSLIVSRDNPDKKKYIDAYNYTLRQLRVSIAGNS